MQKEHQKFVDQYKENEKAMSKAKVRTIALEIIVVGIIVYMKSVQETASLRANIIATSAVLVLLCLHFWDFYPRRALYKKSADIILGGVEFERRNSSSKLSFFKDYLGDFFVLSVIAKMAIFDIILIYFFSVSYTQLLKAINPEVLVKLRPITPISTTLISLSLGWAYYKMVRPLANLKEEMEGSLE